jgi:hypothetical protein
MDTNASMQIGIITGLVCFVGYLPILIVLNGILQTFLYGSWTLTYLRLAEGQETGKAEK